MDRTFESTDLDGCPKRQCQTLETLALLWTGLHAVEQLRATGLQVGLDVEEEETE